MSGFEPERYDTGRAMLLGGLRRSHTMQAAAAGIPAQWQEFVAVGRLPGQLGDIAYGVACGEQPGGFEYMCAVEVESLDALPAGLGRMRVHAQRYAVFVHRGHVSGLHATWQRIINEWLPQAPFQSAHKPDFEVYGPAFDPLTGHGEVEVWISIADRAPA